MSLLSSLFILSGISLASDPTQWIIQRGNDEKCTRCLTTAQCVHAYGSDDWYCCPYLKKCVNSPSMPCFFPVAQCTPVCHDQQWPIDCTCKDPDFPNNWLPSEWEQFGTVPTPAPITPGVGKALATELEHVRLLNELRAQGFTCPNGKTYAPNPTPLQFDCRLWAASQKHSWDMGLKKYFSHTGANGSSFVQRGNAEGISPGAENLAAGRKDASLALEQWKNSDGHCRGMMNPDMVMVGIGYANVAGSPYTHYWTEMLARASQLPADQSCLNTDSDDSIDIIVEDCGDSGKLKKPKGQSWTHQFKDDANYEDACDCETVCTLQEGANYWKFWKKSQKCMCYEKAKKVQKKSKSNFIVGKL